MPEFFRPVLDPVRTPLEGGWNRISGGDDVLPVSEWQETRYMPTIEDQDKRYQEEYRRYMKMPFPELEEQFNIHGMPRPSELMDRDGTIPNHDAQMDAPRRALSRAYAKRIQQRGLNSGRKKNIIQKAKASVQQIVNGDAVDDFEVTDRQRGFLVHEYVSNAAHSAMSDHVLKEMGYSSWKDLFKKTGLDINDARIQQLITDEHGNRKIDLLDAEKFNDLERNKVAERRGTITRTALKAASLGIAFGVGGPLAGIAAAAGMGGTEAVKRAVRYVTYDRKLKANDSEMGFKVASDVISRYMAVLDNANAAVNENGARLRGDVDFDTMSKLMELQGGHNVLGRILAESSKQAIEARAGVVGDLQKLDRFSRKMELLIGLPVGMIIGGGTGWYLSTHGQISGVEGVVGTIRKALEHRLHTTGLSLDLDHDGIYHNVMAFQNGTGQEHMHWMLNAQDYGRYALHPHAHLTGMQLDQSGNMLGLPMGFDQFPSGATGHDAFTNVFVNSPHFHNSLLDAGSVHNAVNNMAQTEAYREVQKMMHDLLVSSVLGGLITPAAAVTLEEVVRNIGAPIGEPTVRQLRKSAQDEAAGLFSTQWREKTPGREEVIGKYYTEGDDTVHRNLKIQRFEDDYAKAPAEIEANEEKKSKYLNMKGIAKDTVREAGYNWEPIKQGDNKVVFAEIDPSQMTLPELGEHIFRMYKQYRQPDGHVSMVFAIDFTHDWTNGYLYTMAQRQIDSDLVRQNPYGGQSDFLPNNQAGRNVDVSLGMKENPEGPSTGGISGGTASGVSFNNEFGALLPGANPNIKSKATAENAFEYAQQYINRYIEMRCRIGFSGPDARFDRATDRVSFIPRGSGMSAGMMPDVHEWAAYTKQKVRPLLGSNQNVDEKVLVHNDVIRHNKDIGRSARKIVLEQSNVNPRLDVDVRGVPPPEPPKPPVVEVVEPGAKPAPKASGKGKGRGPKTT